MQELVISLRLASIGLALGASLGFANLYRDSGEGIWLLLLGPTIGVLTLLLNSEFKSRT